MDNNMKQCIDNCLKCYRVCQEHLSRVCLEKGGEHLAADHVVLMRDCMDICLTSANFMMRASKRHEATCGVCADICEACADDCQRLDGMDECVAACRRCAESCRSMSGAAA